MTEPLDCYWLLRKLLLYNQLFHAQNTQTNNEAAKQESVADLSKAGDKKEHIWSNQYECH